MARLSWAIAVIVFTSVALSSPLAVPQDASPTTTTTDPAALTTTDAAAPTTESTATDTITDAPTATSCTLATQLPFTLSGKVYDEDIYCDSGSGLGAGVGTSIGPDGIATYTCEIGTQTTLPVTTGTKTFDPTQETDANYRCEGWNLTNPESVNRLWEDPKLGIGPWLANFADSKTPDGIPNAGWASAILAVVDPLPGDNGLGSCGQFGGECHFDYKCQELANKNQGPHLLDLLKASKVLKILHFWPGADRLDPGGTVGLRARFRQLQLQAMRKQVPGGRSVKERQLDYAYSLHDLLSDMVKQHYDGNEQRFVKALRGEAT